jgi:4-hydroxy-tetrahydrodipicolinate reductase
LFLALLCISAEIKLPSKKEWIMSIRVCLAGVTGWVGRELTTALVNDPRFTLVGAVARKASGQTLREVLGIESDLVIKSSMSEALNDCEVFVDYTAPGSVKAHVDQALDRGIHVVIGTSGLADTQLEEISKSAERKGVGVFTAGNFALTATLLQECAKMIARHVSHYEIIDYAPTTKTDAPSSTARETAYHLAKVKAAQIDYPVKNTHGVPECRGGTVNGVQIHSVRLPSFHFGFEVIFGLSDERLSLRHEAGSSSRPYVGGTMLAIEKVKSFTGLRRGLQTLLTF